MMIGHSVHIGKEQDPVGWGSNTAGRTSQISVIHLQLYFCTVAVARSARDLCDSPIQLHSPCKAGERRGEKLSDEAQNCSMDPRQLFLKVSGTEKTLAYTLIATRGHRQRAQRLEMPYRTPWAVAHSDSR